MSVLLGNGNGTFRARQGFTTGDGADAVAVGDFNGDGVLDHVSADEFSSTVSVLLGNTERGVGALLPFSLATRDDARSAMTYVAQEQVRLSAQRGQIGAFQSRTGMASMFLPPLAKKPKPPRAASPTLTSPKSRRTWSTLASSSRPGPQCLP